MGPVRPVPSLRKLLFAAASASLLAGGGGLLALDPLPGLLTDGDDPAQRQMVRERVSALGEAACPTLSAYAGAPDPRAREHAVTAMDEAGCDRFEDYRDFFSDKSAWVVRAVVLALGHHRIAGGVPFLLAHLEDRRRLVSEGDSVGIAESAEQVLRRLTAQPIEPEGSAPRGVPGAHEAAVAAAWRAWHRGHGGEPAAKWLADGRAAMRAALASGSPQARYAALETMALVGEPADDLLVEALKRRPGEITTALQCAPDEPPRVTEEIPCTLVLRNDAARRIPLALGEIDLHLGPVVASAAPPATAPGTAAGKTADGKGSRGKEIKKDDGKGKRPAPGTAPGTAPATPPEPRPAPELLAAAIVDLAPGETLRRPVRVGPVAAAGRYEAIASFQDLGRRLDPAAFPPDLPRLEASLFLRFEQ
jgi:hypothetical protein